MRVRTRTHSRAKPRPAPVSASAHNRVLEKATGRAEELEGALADILAPILDRAGRTAAAAFRRTATDHMTASALREADAAAGARACWQGLAFSRTPGTFVPPLAAAGALDGVTALSTMICVKPRPEEAAAIADPDGAPAETLHVTLAYLGEFDGDLAPLVDALKAVAASHAPLSGVVGGYGRFEPPGVGILLPDVPGLVELRVAVSEALVAKGIAYGREHGFEAHITVDGDPEDDEMEMMLARAAQAPLHFDALLLVQGDATVATLPLVGVPPLTAAGGADAISDANVELAKRQKDLRAALESGDQDRIEAAKKAVAGAKEALRNVVVGPRWTPPAADELLDTDSLVRTLRTKTEPVRESLIATTMAPSLAQAGLDFDVTNPLVSKALATTGAKIVEITDTTRANVMKVVALSWEQGLSIPDTAKAIQVAMREASTVRARTIARTELVGAVNSGSLAATQLVSDATGSAYLKQWRTAPGAPNPRHELYPELDGQTVALDGLFDVGDDQLAYPGDPTGSPEEVINCFPAETLVEMPFLRGATRRWYEGDLVRVRLSTGHELAATPNHPVLRADGIWTPIGELDEGCYLICASNLGKAKGAPNPDRPPTKISEAYRLARVAGDTERVRLAPPDFHGDGTDGEVDVVTLDGSLLLDRQAASEEEIVEFGFSLTAFARFCQGGGDIAPLVGIRQRYLDGKASGSVSGAGERSSLPILQPEHAETVRLGRTSHWNAHLPEPADDGAAADSYRFGDPENGFPALVTHAKVIQIDREPFHGFVYNLDTGAGWYTANTVVCRNCRCTMIYVDGESAEPTAAAVRQSIDEPTDWTGEPDPRTEGL